MSSMLYPRKEDLSIVYWLKNLFTATPMVTIVDGYPDADLVIPSISLEPDVLETLDYQLGDRTGANFRTWYIDIFANNKTQRNEFAYKIQDELKNGITVYDIVNGVPTLDVIGHLNIIKRRIKIVRIDPELVLKMYYRASVSILAVNDLIQED